MKNLPFVCFAVLIILNCVYPVMPQPSASLLVANFETRSEDSKSWGILFSRILADKVAFAPEEIIYSPFIGQVEKDIYTLYKAQHAKEPWSRDEAAKIASIQDVENVLTGVFEKKGTHIVITADLYNVRQSKSMATFKHEGEVQQIPEFMSTLALDVLNTLQVNLSGNNRKYINRRTPENHEIFQKALDIFKPIEDPKQTYSEEWKKITELDPNFEFAFVEWANRTFYEDKLLGARIAWLAKEKFPDYGRIRILYIGQLYQTTSDHTNTLRECDAYLKENPWNIRVLTLKSYAFYYQKKYKEAIETITPAAQKYYRNWILQNDIGWYAMQWAYTARAGHYLSEITPENRKIFSENVRLAVEKYQDAAEIFPESGQVWTNLVSGYRESGFDTAYVEKAFEKAYSLIPYNYDAVSDMLSEYQYGYSFDPDKARALIARVLKDYPDDPRFYYIGAKYWDHTLNYHPQKMPDAKVELQSLLEKYARVAEIDDPNMQYAIEMMREIGIYDIPYEILKKIINNPDRAPQQYKRYPHELYRYAGETARKTKDYDNAFIYYKKALEQSPCPTCAYECLFGLGRIYGVRKQYEDAFQHFEKAIALNPEVDSAYFYYAFLSQESGLNLNRGLECALKVTQLEPGSGDSWRLLAQVYYKMGQRDKSLEHIEKALKISPDSQYFKNLKKKFSEGR